MNDNPFLNGRDHEKAKQEFLWWLTDGESLTSEAERALHGDTLDEPEPLPVAA